MAGLINALFARSFDEISIVPTFILTPLTYLGGIFYSVDMLPRVWEQLSYLNPILYMVNAFRHGFSGITDIHVGTSLFVILFFNVLFFCIAWRMLVKGVGIRT